MLVQCTARLRTTESPVLARVLECCCAASGLQLQATLLSPPGVPAARAVSVGTVGSTSRIASSGRGGSAPCKAEPGVAGGSRSSGQSF